MNIVKWHAISRLWMKLAPATLECISRFNRSEYDSMDNEQKVTECVNAVADILSKETDIDRLFGLNSLLMRRFEVVIWRTVARIIVEVTLHTAKAIRRKDKDNKGS